MAEEAAKGSAGLPVAIETERCSQCGGRLCTRIGLIACVVCGLPWGSHPPDGKGAAIRPEPEEPARPAVAGLPGGDPPSRKKGR